MLLAGAGELVTSGPLLVALPVAVLAMGIALLVWRTGLRRYVGAGS